MRTLQITRTKTWQWSVAWLLLMSSPGLWAQSLQPQLVTRSFTEPIQTSVVAATDTGVVHSMMVREGELVEAGQYLARLNHKVLLETKRIAVARSNSTARRDAARSQVKLLQVQMETLKTLVEGGHANHYEFDQRAGELESAVAEMRAAEDELHLAKLEVERIDAQLLQRLIRSPIDGFVAKIHKQPGEHVSSNEPQFATVVQIAKLKVRFYLTEEMLDEVRMGQVVNVLVGRKRNRHSATVTFVSPIIDSDSGTGRVEVTIENADLKIRSGVVCHWDGLQRPVAQMTKESQAK